MLTAGTDKPMEIIEPMQNEAVESEMSNNPMHKAHAAPRRIKADWAAVPCACSARLEGVPNARCTRRRA